MKSRVTSASFVVGHCQCEESMKKKMREREREMFKQHEKEELLFNEGQSYKKRVKLQSRRNRR